jgi:hypothetical protein
VYIPFFIGDDYFEHVFLVSGQLIESLLIGADFVQEYGAAVHFKTSCLIYETEGNLKECKFTNKVEAGMEPQQNIGHGLPGAADHDVMQTVNDESVSTMRKYVAFVSRRRELYDEVIEGEVNPLDLSVKKDGRRNTPRRNKVLRKNMDNDIEFNACDKTNDFKGKMRKEDLVDYVHQGSGRESKLRMDVCERGEADLMDTRQVSAVDLEKLIMSNKNLQIQQKEKLIEVLLRYTEFLTTRPGKCKV